MVDYKLLKLPSGPGIYLFYDNRGLIYVGKATNLRQRVQSYFRELKTGRPIETNLSEIQDIKWLATGSAIEAVLLEAKYIKKFQPKYNVLGKDSKSWNYLVITADKYPRLEAIRQYKLDNNSKSKIGCAINLRLWQKNYKYIFGPFPGIKTVEMIKILRRIFSISTCCPAGELAPWKKPKACFYYQMHQCMGVCLEEITKADYKKKVIEPLVQFLRGNKKKLITSLIKEMKEAAAKDDYEEAARTRDLINKLKHIQDISILTKEFFYQSLAIDEALSVPKRIEGYDISNLGESGKVGSMVVFDQKGPLKQEYRKFKIKTVKGQNDVDCLKEVLARRFKRKIGCWSKPDLILVDGGKAQVNAIKPLAQHIPVVGIAKGKLRKKNEFAGETDINELHLREWVEKNKMLLVAVRDEAHRFAISYQRKLRKIAM